MLEPVPSLHTPPSTLRADYKLSVCIAQRSVRTLEERNFVANLRLLRCGVGLEMALCRIIVDCVACLVLESLWNYWRREALG